MTDPDDHTDGDVEGYDPERAGGLGSEMYRVRGETRAMEAGDGPPVAFVHGNGFDRTQFAPQVEALSDDYRAIAYDQRSRTEFGTDPFDLWDCVADCRALLDCLDVDSCVLAGLSYGGFMAMRLATEHPDLLDGLILIDSRADPHPDAQREQYETLAEQAIQAGAIPDPTYEVMNYNYFGETTRSERQDIVDHWEARYRTYPVAAVAEELHCWLGREDFTDRLAEIDVPTLVLHGEEDVTIDPEHGRTMAERLPDARFELVPDAGHSPTVENPDPVNAAIRDFLDEIDY